MANETFTITETIVHRPGADTDGDGVIDPGEVVRTTVTIANNSTTDTATGLEFTQILAGMTIFDQPGLDDINVSPIAAPDSYNVIGNTTFIVSAADGILNGATAVHFTASADMEFFSATIGANTATQTHIVTTGVIATTGAGSVSLGADGGFTYTPDAGFTGTDTFTYTLTDAGLDGNFATLGDNLTSTGTVSFIVEDLVWFIDNSAAVNGDGTQANPFNSIANFNAVNNGAVQANPSGGDYIFLREGTGTYSTADGINLLDGQTLIGQGENMVVNHSGQGNMLIESGSAGDTPVILVTGAGNQGIQLSADNTIRGLDIGMNNATAVGIKDNGGSVGTLTISNVGVGVGNSIGQAIEFDNGGTLNVLLESVTSSGAAAGIDISLVAGTGNHFTVSGLTTVNDATGFGVLISSSSVNATFTGEVTVLNDAVGADGSGINLTTNTGTYNFNGGVDVTVNGAGVTGLNIQSSNVVNILDPSGTNQIISNNGTAIFINPTTVNAALNLVTSSGGTNGISLTGMSGSLTIATVDIDGQTGDGIDILNSAGSLTINGGTIGLTNDPGGIGVDIQGSNGNVTIGATINKNTAGGLEVVEVTGRTGGTVDFNANITSSLGGGGIDINGNTGGIVRFDGGMTLSTGTVTAFNASGNSSTTIAVTDPGAGSNFLTTTTGTALNVANTTIGGDGLTFQSITAGTAALAPVNGIVLNNTGAGGLNVTGTAGSAGSGGTIQNTTGAGISLTSTGPIVLNRMIIKDSDSDGVSGTTVGGFRLDHSSVTNNGTAVGENGVELFNVTGTASFIDSSFTGNAENNLLIQNTVSTLLNLTVDDSDFQSNSTVFGNDGILLEANGAANIVAAITDSQFHNNRGDHFNFATDAAATSTTQLTYTGNTLTTTDATHTVILGGGIAISPSGSADVTFNVSSNNLQNAFDDAININVGTAATAASLVQGTVSSNIIGTAANAGSGSWSSHGLTVTSNGAATTTVLANANVINQFRNEYGAYFVQKEGPGTLNATVTNNTIMNPDNSVSGILNGIRFQSGATATDTGDLFLLFSGNTIPDSPFYASTVRVFTRFDTDVWLPGYGGGLNDLAAVAAYFTALNPNVVGSPAYSIVNPNAGHGYHNTPGGGAVPTPASPTLPPAVPALPLFAVTPPPLDDLDGGPGAGGGGGPVSPTPDPVTGDPTEPAGDPAPAPHPVIVDDGLLSQAELDYFAGAATAIWTATGLTAEQAAALESLTFTVADMASLTLGSYRPGLITLDNDGAGYGWFLDGTPFDNAEFTGGAGTRITAAPGSAPAGDFDLLTTLLHEMGHALGIGDTYDAAGRDNLMYGYLFTGERRLPGESQADGAVAGSITSEEFAGSPILVNGGNSTTGAFVLPVGTGVTIQWDATIDLQSNDLIVHPSNQGTLSATNAVGFPDTLTDDPAVGGASNPTVTVLDTLELGGTVWLDDGTGGGTAANGVRELGETTVDGVLVTLFADTGSTPGVWDATDTQIGSSILTTGGGDYSFTGLAPGEYIVRIDQDNFDSGGNESLIDAQKSPTTTPEPIDPDNNIDDDDNGARTIGQPAYSDAITLAYNTEPDGTPGGAGDTDGDADDDTNLTLDFGFFGNIPPELTASGGTTAFLEGVNTASTPVVVDSGIVLSDADDAAFDAGGAAITGNFQASEDVLAFTPNAGLYGDIAVVSYVGGALVLASPSGTATVAEWQAALRSITYTNTSDDPNTATRTVAFQVYDGDDPSDLVGHTQDVSITSYNDEPTLTATGDSPTFTEGDPAVDLFDAASASAIETTQGFNSLTLTVSNVTDGSNEILNVDGAAVTLTDTNVVGPTVNGVTATVGLVGSDATVTLTFASLSAATLQAVIDGLTYENSSQSPTDANRVVTITELVDSGSNTAPNDSTTSLAIVSTVNVDPLNDLPVFGGDDTGAVTEAGGVNNGTAGDPDDSGNLDHTDADGVDDLWVPAAAGTASIGGLGTYELSDAGLWTYILDDTDLTVQALNVGGMTTDTFSAVTGDGTAHTVTITINGQDDAAVAKNDSFVTPESTMITTQNVFADNGNGIDDDIDDPSVTVELVNGAASVGTQISLLSGALLTLNSDGTFVYDPNGFFDPTPTLGSGASNTPGIDSFTYKLTNGTTATVTISLTGLDTNDLLLGTAGLDSLAGGAGDDKYVVANSGDTVTELAGGGNDRVSTVVDYQLAAGSHVERLNSISFALTTPLKLTGNEFVNLVEGNAGDNLLDGRGGADTLVGFGGNDKHVVDNAGDVVVELSGGGTDSISTLVDYQLAPGTDVERLNSISWALTLPLKLTGNEIANLIEGNAGNNLLDGREGADRLVGFGGDDKYVVDNAGDVVVEASGGGNDSISTLVDYTLAAGSHVERLNSISWALTTPLTLTGNELVNLIEGNAGDNELDGKLGADRLVGFGGADTFAFTTALGGGVDAIADFQAGIDTIALDDAIFNVLSAGALPAGAFVTGSAAADPDDRIVYNSGTGQLFYDSDGNGAGAAVLFATLQTGLSLTASDFLVI